MGETMTVLISVVGSVGLWQFLQYMINRHDKKDDRAEALEANIERLNISLEGLERDILRAQLLLLISDYPKNQVEVMSVAEEYFNAKGGDWYLSAIFNRYLEENNIGKPEWFKGGSK